MISFVQLLVLLVVLLCQIMPKRDNDKTKCG